MYRLLLIMVIVMLIRFETLCSLTVGAYIHVPFCRRRCYYCDFAIKPIGDRRSTQEDEGRRFTQLLVKEVDQFCDLWRSNYQTELPSIDTIYLGGGTPSLLPDHCVHEILQKLCNCFHLQDDAEITMEMDPGTFDLVRLQSLSNIGE